MKALKTRVIIGVFTLSIYLLTGLIHPTQADAKYRDDSDKLKFSGSTALVVLTVATAGVLTLVALSSGGDDKKGAETTGDTPSNDTSNAGESTNGMVEPSVSHSISTPVSSETKLGVYYDCELGSEASHINAKPSISDLRVKVGLSLSF